MYMYKGVMNVKCLIVKDWTIFTIFTIHNIKFQMGEGGGEKRATSIKIFFKMFIKWYGKASETSFTSKKKIFKYNSYPTGTQLYMYFKFWLIPL